MAMMHLMVPGSTILGWLAMPSQMEFCTPTGLNQVIKSLLSIFFAMLMLIPSPGYDHIIQKHIYHFLGMDNQFSAHIADLLANQGNVSHGTVGHFSMVSNFAFCRHN